MWLKKKEKKKRTKVLNVLRLYLTSHFFSTFKCLKGRYVVRPTFQKDLCGGSWVWIWMREDWNQGDLLADSYRDLSMKWCRFEARQWKWIKVGWGKTHSITIVRMLNRMSLLLLLYCHVWWWAKVRPGRRKEVASDFHESLILGLALLL